MLLISWSLGAFLASRAPADQTLTYPESETHEKYQITSECGPRLLATSPSKFDSWFQFHPGIDFAGPPIENDPIRALEAGTFSLLVAGYSAPTSVPGMVAVKIIGDSSSTPHGIRYVHSFPHQAMIDFSQRKIHEVDVPLPDGSHIRMTDLAENGFPAIVKDSSLSSTTADYVLQHGLATTVSFADGELILDNSSHVAKSSSIVATNQVLAPVGTSGPVTGPHVHIDLSPLASAPDAPTGNILSGIRDVFN